MSDPTNQSPAQQGQEVSKVHPVPISTQHTSGTVLMLSEKERPQPENICNHCVYANWFTIPAEVKCFCRHMKSIVWQTHKPQPITRCDLFADVIPEKD